jgi:hypothetical protein
MHARQGRSSVHQRKKGRWVAALTLCDGRRSSFYAHAREKVTQLLVQSKEESNEATGTR